MDSNLNIMSDPKIIGPGVWYITHLTAKEATTNKKIDEFIDYMHLLANNFSCKKCRTHIQNYINTHPFEDLIYLENEHGVRIGMFKWAWMFHNAVNARIHKPYMDWDTAWGMYDNETELCSKNCEDVDNFYDNDNPNTKNTNNNHENNPNIINPFPHGKSRKSKLVQGYFMNIGIPNNFYDNNPAPDNLIIEGIPNDMVSFRPVY